MNDTQLTHEEIQARREARYQRRMERLEREVRRECIVSVLKYVVMGLLFYAYLFLGALWASC